MILPYLDYGDILLMGASVVLSGKLQKLQTRALRICTYGYHIDEDILHSDSKIAKLTKRRMAHLCNFMFRKKYDPTLIDDRDIQTRQRDAPVFKTIIPKCEKYKHRVYYNGAVLWNSLPPETRNIDSYNSFKSHQKQKMLEL